MTSFLAQLIRYLLIVMFGQGVLLWLHRAGIYPEEWVARLIGIAITEETLVPVGIATLALSAFGVSVIVELVGIPRVRRWITSRGRGENYEISTVKPGRGESGSSAANYHDIHVDERSVALAGLVSALLERALDYGFRLPVPASDSFVGRYEVLKDSDHPIWTNRIVNQLRREFLHYVGVVGSAHEVRETAREREEDRQQLARFGRLLIDFLKGGIRPMSAAAQMALDRLPHLSESAGQYAALAKRSRKLYYVQFLWEKGSTPLYGTQPDSNVLRRVEIPQDEVGQWHFEDDGNLLKKTHEPHVYYNNIHLRQDDLDAVIRSLGP